MFVIEAVDLGELKKVIVGHDGKGVGSGWLLEKVVIQPSLEAEFVFHCHQWLDEGEEDGLLERVLHLQEPQGRT